MWSPSFKKIALLSGASLMAFSGLAAAQDGAPEGPAEEPEDTTFNFGYDDVFHLFVWNTSSSSTEGPDCTLENGTLSATYGEPGDLIPIDELADDVGDAVTFPDPEGDVDPLPYTPDGECSLNAAEVAGPNGQINHGMFMKLFNSLYEGTGRGCINRHLAQSDLGKGDQQIKTDDVDELFEAVTAGEIGEIDFATFAADCERGKPGHDTAEIGDVETNGRGNGKGHGNDQNPGIESGDSGDSGSHGRSADAPGRNK